MRLIEHDDNGQQQQEDEQRQREEDPCEDRCFLKEHKGYDTCQRAGVCQYTEAFGKDTP